MKQATFEAHYRPLWQTLEQLLAQLDKGTALATDDLQRFTQLYRKICHFHALAKERQYSSFLVDHLEDMVVRAHQHMYRRRHAFSQQLLAFVVRDFPCLVRREKRMVIWATALFLVPALVLFMGSLVAPELVYTVVDPAQTAQFEAMYNPDDRIIGHARDANSNWAMFGFYINNNVSVAFRTFASGILLGLGSSFFLIYNGALMGAIAAHLTNVGYTSTFFTFVVGHGSFELTAIVLAGAAGLKLGYAVLAPGQLPRTLALKNAAGVAIQIVYGVIIMLLIAAFIEAFWSANNTFAPWQKYLVGGVLWLVVFAYLGLSGRPRAAPVHRRSNAL